MTFRLGVDIGGTFTDAFIYDQETGEIKISKVSSTPPNFVEGVWDVFKKSEIDLTNVSHIVHGSTIVDNAIIQRILPKTCLITTEGFRDLLFIGRYWREELFNIQWDRPTQFRPFIERKDIFTVTERVSSDGEVVTPLNEEKTREITKKIRENEYESVAVFFINSYVNPVHEEKVSSIVASECSNAYISISSDICPIIRELPRLCTTVLNACIQPIVDKYVKDLVNLLSGEKFLGELLIMQSNGGMIKWDVALSKPVHIATSGPAAGVTASRYIAETLGIADAISFDMGGTTAKSATIMKGEPIITTESLLEWDVPLAVPAIDMVEIGAGGGSIAWIDTGGMLRVGPMSAGAIPGPVCYSTGGDEPSVTDANLTLGFLNPEYFLGGKLKLDAEAAKNAVKEKIADPLGLPVEKAAAGIVKIANTNMVQSCRTLTIERGYDPRDFTLIAFGGAGAMHAHALAEELEITKIIVPLDPGVFSAYGLCVADFFCDFVKTYFVQADRVNLVKLNEVYKELKAKALNELRKEGVPENRIELYAYVKMKYVREMLGWGLEVPAPSGEMTEKAVRELIERFHDAHELHYGFSRRGEAAHFVDLRVRGTGRTKKMKLREWQMDGEDPSKAFKGRREAFFNDWIRIPIYERGKLKAGNIIGGPSIIEEPTSTILVPENFRAEVDRFRNTVLTNLG